MDPEVWTELMNAIFAHLIEPVERVGAPSLGLWGMPSWLGEYTAMGDAVNLAARMEQTAAPGTSGARDVPLRGAAVRVTSAGACPRSGKMSHPAPPRRDTPAVALWARKPPAARSPGRGSR